MPRIKKTAEQPAIDVVVPNIRYIAPAVPEKLQAAPHLRPALERLAANPDFAPFWEESKQWLLAEATSIAIQSGGQIDPGAFSIVESAAFCHACETFYLSQFASTMNTAFISQAIKVGEAKSRHIIAAVHLAAREAAARRAIAQKNVDSIDVFAEDETES